jgi:hypothetical protein
MSRKIIRWIFVTLILSILMKAISPPSAAGSAPSSPVFNYRDTDAGVEAKIEAALPQGLAMVDHAIARLSQEAASLSAAEWALFERFFDPAGTGDMDEAFVLTVLENYGKIRSEFESGLVVEYETANSMCIGMRLYYTEFIKVHICPYFQGEQDAERIARDFVHELAHIALFAKDRVYYSPGSVEYAKLTPYGHWTSRLPLVGRLFGEITLQDTLYNPDAYSEFAYALSELGGSAVDEGVGATTYAVAAK